MSDVQADVLNRKLESARTISSPLPRMNDVLDQYSKNVEKNARAYIGCVVEAMILETEARRFSDILDAISMPAMIGLVEIEEIERAALINIDLDLIYHVVDLRMGGSPTELPEFVARRPTSIDWSILLPLVEIALDAFADAVSNVFNVPEKIAVSCDSYEHQPMLANIATDHADTLFVRTALDIGEAARSGNFDLIIPFSSLDLVKSKVLKNATIGQSAHGDAWAEHMINVVLETEVDLLPVLQTSLYSVAELSRLEVGQTLPLDEDAHQNMRILLDAPDTSIPIAKGRLGAFKGRKAMKLTEKPDHEFLAPLQDVVSTVSAKKES